MRAERNDCILNCISLQRCGKGFKPPMEMSSACKLLCLNGFSLQVESKQFKNH